MVLRVYYLKSCDTCRKAIKALEDEPFELQLIDVREDGVPPPALKRWVDSQGFAVVMNTRSTTWRDLDDNEKADMTNEKAIALMTKYPTLIKRPVISDGDTVTVGWKADVQSQWLNESA